MTKMMRSLTSCALAMLLLAGCGGTAPSSETPVVYLADQVPLDFGPEVLGTTSEDAAWLALMEGRNDDARRTFAEIPENTASPLALFGRAEVELLDGDISAATHFHSRLVKRYPGSPLARFSIERLDRMLLPMVNDFGEVSEVIETDWNQLALESRLPMVRIGMVLAEREATANGDKPIDRLAWGAPSQWAWAGPFNFHAVSGFDASYGPESEEQLKGSYIVDGRPINTQNIESARQLVQPAWMNTGVYYLESWIEVSRSTEVIVSLRAFGQANVWVDGELVLERNAFTADAHTDGARLVTLAAGRHRVLIKYGVAAGDPGFQFFVVPTQGTAPFDLKTAQPGRVSEATVGAMLRLRGGLPDELAEISNAPFHLWLASLFAERAGDHARGRQAVLLALPLVPRFAPLLLTDAQLYEGDAGLDPTLRLNLAIDRYKEVLEADPRAGQVHLHLGSVLLQEEQAEDALAEFDALVALTPNESRAHWYRYLTLSTLGWTRPAEMALRTASRLSPGNCDLAREVIETDAAQGRYLTPDTVPEQVKGCTGIRQALAEQYHLPRNDIDAAIEVYQWLVDIEPESALYQVRLAELYTQRGDTDNALASYRRAEQLTLTTRRIYLADRVDLLLAANRDDEARALVLDALEAEPANIELIELLRQFGGERVLAELRRNGLDVVQEYLADPSRDYQQSAFYILDYAAFRFFPDGSGLSVTHQITRVLNKDAKNRLGEVRVPPGAIVTVLRTIKADGVTTIEPELIRNKPSVSMPNLEVGDFIEFEYITATEPRVEGTTSFMAPRWYFQIFEAPLMYSEIIVDVPAGIEPIVDVRGDVPDPTVSNIQQFTRYRWLMTEMLAPRPEPLGPSMLEIVPSIQVGYDIDPELFRGTIRDSVMNVVQPTAYLRQALDKARAGNTEPKELARRLFQFVKSEIAEEGDAYFAEPASWIWTRREGNRITLLKALLDMAGVTNDVILVKPFGSPEKDNPLTALGAYTEVVLRVDVGEERALWLDPTQTYSRFDYLRPELQGQPGISLGSSLEDVVVHDYDDAIDRQTMHFTLHIQDDGSLRGVGGETSDGINGTFLRNFISRFDGNSEEVRLRLADYIRPWFGDVEVNDHQFLGMDGEGEVTVGYEFEAAAFARESETGLTVQTAIFADELGTNFAALPSRELPLVLSSAIDADMHVELHLPDGFDITMAPESHDIQTPFGHYMREVVVGDDRVIRINEQMRLPKQRVEPADYAAFQAFARQVDEAQLIRVEFSPR